MTVRIAAVGDVHFSQFETNVDKFFEPLQKDKVDVLLLAGDLTHDGSREDTVVLLQALKKVPPYIPVVAVLGNHDCANDIDDEIVAMLRQIGVIVLGYNTFAIELTIQGVRLGIAGTTGFGGGFGIRTGANFGEKLMREFMGYSEWHAKRLHDGLRTLRDCDTRIALTHYAPSTSCIRNEHKEIYAWLGSSKLLVAAREGRADLYFHGHAHRGPLKGHSAGLPIRNVAHPLVARRYHLMAYANGRWSDIASVKEKQ